MYQKMRSLATPATPDQFEQRATLVSHLTIITDPWLDLSTRRKLARTILPWRFSLPTRNLRYSYNSYMRSVNIAELKNRLSAYLQHVRAGEEILIRDRDLPVAKLVPLSPTDASSEELALAASGEMLLPLEPLDERAFWSIGAGLRSRSGIENAVAKAVTKDREDRDAGLLGR
jgi:prevent-host-death family protein